MLASIWILEKFTFYHILPPASSTGKPLEKLPLPDPHWKLGTSNFLWVVAFCTFQMPPIWFANHKLSHTNQIAHNVYAPADSISPLIVPLLEPGGIILPRGPLTWRPTVLTGHSGGKLIDLFLADTSGLRDVGRFLKKYVILDQKHLALVCPLICCHTLMRKWPDDKQSNKRPPLLAATLIWPIVQNNRHS